MADEGKKTTTKRDRDGQPKPAGAKRPGKAAPIEEDPDALMTATLRAMEWAQKRRKQIVYGVAIVIAGGGIAFGYSYWRSHQEEQATSLVAKGVNAELAPLRTGDEDPEIARRLKFYGNEAEKQQDALAAYAEARKKYGDTGPGILARLGEAGIYLDKRDWDQALAAYNEVKSTSLAAADPSLRLRCLEGLGYAKEGKGLLDDARAAFNDLANLDLKGAKPLGLYHLARIDVAKGDKAGAIDKLKTAREAVTAPGAISARYLQEQIDRLLGRLDPTAVPKTPTGPGQIPGMPAGAGPGGKLTKEQIEAFLKSMGTNMPQGPAPGGPPPGGAPPPPPPPAPPAPPAGSP